MDFSRVPPLVVRLAVLFVAAGGAQLAWNRRYLACFALCFALVLWVLARIVSDGLWRRSRDGEGEGAAWSAVLEREREARRLTAFLDHAPVPLLAMRSRGALSAINLSARRFFSTDDVIVDPPPQLVAAVLGVQPGVRQTLVLDVEGRPRTYALTLAEVVSDGDFVRIVALVDIEAEVAAAEAAALRDLMQVLSHEIMNSLTPVTSLAQSTAELLRQVEGTNPALDQARGAADSMARRSRGLLDFVEAYREMARIPPPRLAETDIADLIEEVTLLFRNRWAPETVALEVSVEGAPPAMMDRNLLSQALLNVLANAAEAATAVSGTPVVRLEATSLPSGRTAFRITDNGAGIDLPDPYVALRPFFTTKANGTGVGLSMVRQIVLAHGGEVQLGPAAPSGTVVTLLL